MEVELSQTEQAVLNAIVNNESIFADLSEISSEVEFEKVEINQNPGHRLVA